MSNRLVKVHHLKTWPIFFNKIISSIKNFEIRQNDRDYRCGDYLCLEEFDPIREKYTGRSHNVEITYITDFGQPERQLVMAIKKAECIDRDQINRCRPWPRFKMPVSRDRVEAAANEVAASIMESRLMLTHRSIVHLLMRVFDMGRKGK